MRLGEVANLTVRLRPVEDGLAEEEPVDRVLLDLPEPWKLTRAASRARCARAGSSSATCRRSCSRTRSPRRSSASRTGRWSRPSRRSYRPWNIEGQSVRPFHRMVAHTGIHHRRAPGRPGGEREVGCTPQPAHRPSGDAMITVDAALPRIASDRPPGRHRGVHRLAVRLRRDRVARRRRRAARPASRRSTARRSPSSGFSGAISRTSTPTPRSTATASRPRWPSASGCRSRSSATSCRKR